MGGYEGRGLAGRDTNEPVEEGSSEESDLPQGPNFGVHGKPGRAFAQNMQRTCQLCRPLIGRWKHALESENKISNPDDASQSKSAIKL